MLVQIIAYSVCKNISVLPVKINFIKHKMEVVYQNLFKIAEFTARNQNVFNANQHSLYKIITVSKIFQAVYYEMQKENANNVF